jgi:hypothetical protein
MDGWRYSGKRGKPATRTAPGSRSNSYARESEPHSEQGKLESSSSVNPQLRHFTERSLGTPRT